MRLDAGGRSLFGVFSEESKHRKQSFRNWLINLDIWGSYLPLNAEANDI
jgi:hypothetical protein